MPEQCPVCLSEAERGRDRDYGDKKQIRCPRCGPFQISGSALAMLRSRLEQDRLASARLSHAIRSKTTDTDWLFITSANLDDLVKEPLPDIPHQVDRLVQWLAASLGDEHLGRVSIAEPTWLAGVVGVVGGDQVVRLLTYAAKEGVIEFSGGEAGLTARGWKMVDALGQQWLEQDAPDLGTTSEAARQPEPVAMEIVKAHCNQCGGGRKAQIRASYTADGTDGQTSWSNTHEVLECCGCGGVSVRRQHWFSEWDYIEGDDANGTMRLVPGIRVTYWPPETKRHKPAWASGLSDSVLRGIFDEVYQALNAGLTVLASIGTRTLLDRAMYLRVDDPPGGFKGKFDRMVQEGYIGREERTILEIIADAGNAAAHRGFAPAPQMLTTIIAAVETFLYREFVLKSEARAVKSSTPPREKR
jgi:hypothetical protein